MLKEDYGINLLQASLLFIHVDHDKDGFISLADLNLVSKTIARDMSRESHSSSRDSSPRVPRHTR